MNEFLGGDVLDCTTLQRDLRTDYVACKVDRKVVISNSIYRLLGR
jgi:hypothetical protein